MRVPQPNLTFIFSGIFLRRRGQRCWIFRASIGPADKWSEREVPAKQEEEMTPTDQSMPTRVSILARLVPAFSYGLPAFGAAVSAWFFAGVMRAMRFAETAISMTVAYHLRTYWFYQARLN
jgi:hypothetical protein